MTEQSIEWVGKCPKCFNKVYWVDNTKYMSTCDCYANMKRLPKEIEITLNSDNIVGDENDNIL